MASDWAPKVLQAPSKSSFFCFWWIYTNSSLRSRILGNLRRSLPRHATLLRIFALRSVSVEKKRDHCAARLSSLELTFFFSYREPQCKRTWRNSSDPLRDVAVPLTCDDYHSRRERKRAAGEASRALFRRSTLAVQKNHFCFCFWMTRLTAAGPQGFCIPICLFWFGKSSRSGRGKGRLYANQF